MGPKYDKTNNSSQEAKRSGSTLFPIFPDMSRDFPTFLKSGARLNLGKKHLDHQNWENLMQSKRTGLPFSI